MLLDCKTYPEYETRFFDVMKALPRSEALQMLKQAGILGADHDPADLAAEYEQIRLGARRSWDQLHAFMAATETDTPERAYDVALMWGASHEELQQKKARIAQLEAEKDQRELATLIDIAKAQHRWTPAREKSVRDLFASRDLTMHAAKQVVSGWSVIAALKAGADKAVAHTGSAGPGGTPLLLRHDGKTYAQMTGAERARLKRESPETFEALRAEWSAAGRPPG